MIHENLVRSLADSLSVVFQIEMIKSRAEHTLAGAVSSEKSVLALAPRPH